MDKINRWTEATRKLRNGKTLRKMNRNEDCKMGEQSLVYQQTNQTKLCVWGCVHAFARSSIQSAGTYWHSSVYIQHTHLRCTFERNRKFCLQIITCLVTCNLSCTCKQWHPNFDTCSPLRKCLTYVLLLHFATTLLTLLWCLVVIKLLISFTQNNKA